MTNASERPASSSAIRCGVIAIVPAAGDPPLPIPRSIELGKPTIVRYTVLAWACSLSMLTYIDRVCIKTVRGDMETSLGIDTGATDLVIPVRSPPSVACGIQRLGQTPYGERRIIDIQGGTVEGPRLNGKVLPGGADWLLVRADGVGDLDVRGILVKLLREGKRELRWLHLVKIDHAPLGLRDDLLRHHEYIAPLQLHLLRLHRPEYK